MLFYMTKQQLKKLFFSLALTILSLSATAANITNMSVRQEGQTIVITYDLDKKSDVLFFLLEPYFDSFILSTSYRSKRIFTSLSGDVGSNVSAGKNKRIVWHILDYYGKDEYSLENVKFELKAVNGYYASPYITRKHYTKTFILSTAAYSFVPQLSYGGIIGQTYYNALDMGWYAKFRSNFQFDKATNNLHCDETGYVNNVLPFYSGVSKTSHVIATAGYVWDFGGMGCTGLFKNRLSSFGFYLGGGYGQRLMLWETIDGQLIQNDYTSYKGFAGDLGLLLGFGGFTMMFGVTTINFQYLELEASVGWTF